MDSMYAKRLSRLPVGVLPLFAACYTQRPLTVPVPAVGTQIVASVTDSGVVAMSNALGPGALEVEGVIAAAITPSTSRAPGPSALLMATTPESVTLATICVPTAGTGTVSGRCV